MKKYLQFLTICAVLFFTAGNVLAQQKAQVAYPFTEKSMPTALNTVKLSKSMSLSKQATVSSAVDVDAALAAGADRLVEMQYTDGSWGWPLTAPPTHGNIIGPITMGLAQAYDYTLDGNHLAGLTAAGAYLLTKTNNFSPSDGYLANKLDQVFGGSTYTDHVIANFYGPLAAGTYNKNGAGTLYDTEGYVNLIRTDRAGDGIPNLAAWDIGMGLVGAASCGVTGTELTDWIVGVKAEIDELDGADSYDVIGLAGAIYGLAFVGEDFDPTSGEHAAATNINDLADILASYQIDLGGFTWNSNYMSSSDYDETIQETAYSLLALYEVDKCNYSLNVHGAANYMISVQLANGGWKNWELGGENNEITGEAMWGIAIIEDYPIHNVTQDTWHCTIQAAVDAASAGDVINVAAGTYPEQLLITKALTINGADGAILDGTTLGLKIVGVKIKSGDVTFNNVDLAHFSGNGIIVGYDASPPGSLKNVHITNCKISDVQPGYSHGFGIYVGHQSEDFKRPYGSPKLTEHLDYSGLLIEGNEIVNTRASSLVLQSITGTPGTLVVQNNYIHDGENDGIWIDCARNIVIENNIVKGNVDGIYISSYGDAYIAGSNWEYDWTTPHLNGPYGPKNIQITGNQIVDNYLYGGVYLDHGYPATIFINGNTITGNTPVGVTNRLSETVNTTCNWWGNASGPNHPITNSGGTGNAVSDNVTFLPWLVTSDLDGSCTLLNHKIGVRDDLTALLQSGDKKTDDRLEKAIKHIEKSMDDKLWEDGDYLTKKGKRVFDEEKKAVKELEKIVKDKKGLLKTDAEAAIIKLVAIDKSLAQNMIDKARAESGDSKEIEKAEKEMEKAQKELDELDKKSGDPKPDYDKAIDHYKKAWEHAYKALKKVGALGKYSTTTDELAVTTIPEEFSLGNNYPNPFNPTTLISYNLPEASQVTMTVYDLMGKKVKTLVQGFQPAGNHSVLWNATNDNGVKMSGGMYFYQIRAGSFQKTHKMILLK